MPTLRQNDNSTFRLKIQDRRRMLNRLSSEPIVMETHGGYGKLFHQVYRGAAKQGAVFEIKEEKADYLAEQRPTWRVYQGDSTAAMLGGIASDLPFNVLDCDPYGQPWPTIDAFLGSRPVVPELWIVVNDGLRQKLQVSGGWRVESLRSIVERRGSDIYDAYLECCEELLNEKAAQAGYSLDRFSGYYCGSHKAMTHYLARLTARGVG